MGTPEQLSSSKTQQVIPGERRQGRSARALTPENQSIVTWRESRATAGPAPPPVLRYRRSQSKRALSRRVGRQSAKEGGGRPGAWGGGKVGGGELAGGEAGERGEGWGAPREEGSCGQAPPMRLFFFFKGVARSGLVVGFSTPERGPGGGGIGTAGDRQRGVAALPAAHRCSAAAGSAATAPGRAAAAAAASSTSALPPPTRPAGSPLGPLARSLRRRRPWRTERLGEPAGGARTQEG